MMKYLKNLWSRWEDIKKNDPVKTRLIYVLFWAAIVLVPFLSIWTFVGFSKALALAVGIIVGGLSIALILAIGNATLGWVAHYILTGQMDWFDFNNTVLEELEWYSKKKTKQKISRSPLVVNQVATGNNNVQVGGSIKLEEGPEWLRKKD
jgi:uncharacterized membrane protein (DUF485 family)